MKSADLDEVAKLEAKKQKLERVKAEIKKLKAQFSKLDAKTKKTAASLIENAAFMIITLEDLQENINLNGVISEYQNGENQWGTKKSPEVEIYNTMVKNHMAIIKQLTDLVPKQSPGKGSGEDDDGFDSFVNDR